MRVRITLDLDMDAYRAKYGPGTEYWNKHRTRQVRVTGEDGDMVWQTVIEPAEAYEFDRNSKLVEEMVRDILEEGFYDWDSQGWLRVGIGEG